MVGGWGSTSLPGVTVYPRLRLAQQPQLKDVQDAELALVDRDPVVLEDAAGIPRVGVPRPVCVADALRVQEVHQAALPHSSGIPTYRAASALPQKHRANPMQLRARPAALPT